jgi:hypothetical protein
LQGSNLACSLSKDQGQQYVPSILSSPTIPHFALLLHVSQIVLPLKSPLIRPSVLLSESFDLLTGLVVFPDLPHILFVDREHLEIDELLLHVRKTIASRREKQGIFVRHPRIPYGDRAIRSVERYVVAILLLHVVSVQYSGSEVERCAPVEPNEPLTHRRTCQVDDVSTRICFSQFLPLAIS